MGTVIPGRTRTAVGGAVWTTGSWMKFHVSLVSESLEHSRIVNIWQLTEWRKRQPLILSQALLFLSVPLRHSLVVVQAFFQPLQRGREPVSMPIAFCVPAERTQGARVCQPACPGDILGEAAVISESDWMCTCGASSQMAFSMRNLGVYVGGGVER